MYSLSNTDFEYFNFSYDKQSEMFIVLLYYK